MNAEIITIGDEILIGQIVDTNSQWIAIELNKIGVSVHQISSIKDEEAHIIEALQEAQGRADIVVITGGLGPTNDDITKKTLATYFNDTAWVEYPEVIAHIKSLFKKINHPYKEIQRYQAQLPSKATYLRNQYGTAPGMWFNENDTVFISLPGVPYEMKGLITNEVLPRIQQEFQLPHIIHRTVMTHGQGESVIADRIESWEHNLPTFMKLAYLPSFGRVRLRLSAKGTDKQLLKDTLDQKLKELDGLISDVIIGYEDGFTIDKIIANVLTEQGKTVCTAESITGGKIAATFVSNAGSSAYFKGGFVTYSSETKQELLSVSKDLIAKFSVVSKEVTVAMAESAIKKMNTDYAIAVTGNAGPTTDKTDKSVGDVCIAIAYKNGVLSEEFNFGQPREKVILRTVNKALEMLLKKIQKNN